MSSDDESIEYEIYPADLQTVDIQGINWSNRSITREEFRSQRHLNEYRALTLPIPQITSNYTQSNYFRFKYANRLEPSTCNHFQLRNLLKRRNHFSFLYLNGHKIIDWNPVCHVSRVYRDLGFDVSCFDVLDNSLVVGGMDGELSVGNGLLQFDGIVNCVKIDSNYKCLVGSNSPELKSVDMETLSIQSTEIDFNINCIDTEDMLYIAGGDSCNSIIGDKRTSKPAITLTGHSDYIFACTINQTQLATGSQDKTAILYDIRNTKNHTQFQSNSAVRNLQFSDSLLVVGDHEDFVFVYDTLRIGRRQCIDFFGELNGLSVGRSDLIFSVAGIEFGGIFEFQLVNFNRMSRSALL